MASYLQLRLIAIRTLAAEQVLIQCDIPSSIWNFARGFWLRSYLQVLDGRSRHGLLGNRRSAGCSHSRIFVKLAIANCYVALEAGVDQFSNRRQIHEITVHHGAIIRTGTDAGALICCTGPPRSASSHLLPTIWGNPATRVKVDWFLHGGSSSFGVLSRGPNSLRITNSLETGYRQLPHWISILAQQQPRVRRPMQSYRGWLFAAAL